MTEQNEKEMFRLLHLLVDTIENVRKILAEPYVLKENRKSIKEEKHENFVTQDDLINNLNNELLETKVRVGKLEEKVFG